MKLINFYSSKRLNSLLEEMGAELKKIKSTNAWDNITDSKLAELLKKGEVEVSVDEILTKDGVFEYKGRKVIVYIRDQYAKYHTRGYKFHLTKCTAINNAFQNKRNSRYVVSLRTDGNFKINLLDDDQIVQKDLIEPMKVCKYCLGQLDYKKYKSMFNKEKNKICNEFNLEEFFSMYNHITNLNPNGYRSSTNAPLNIYNKGFKNISKSIRENKDFKCNDCGVDMSKKEHRKFSHVHHKDADKSNDNPANLEVLCIECHSNQPGHNRLKYSNDFRSFISKKSKGEF
ncbi:HNH endonuclease signature motif containing protein [uncultured Polaribacter sp.]|uniref:HNH endonuclease signature motif containing protein n=1 Tax=uncultured Polaribacter sp. TaxID=174711 RepID=UPI003703F466